MGSSFTSLAYDFWSLTRNSIDLIEKQGYKRVYLFSGEETDVHKKYQEQTKWNNFNVGIPILFNFYHGLELFMKGLLDSENIKFNTNHNLKNLFIKIDENRILYTTEIIDLLKKHVYHSDSYNSFFKENNLDVNDFIAFRYPKEKNSEKIFNYQLIKGSDEDAKKLFIELKNATIDLYNASVRWRCKSENCNEFLIDY